MMATAGAPVVYREAPAASEHSSKYWRDQVVRLKNEAAKKIADSWHIIRAVLDTGEVLLSIGGFGYIWGRYGYMPKRLGIPIDLGIGGVLKIGAFFLTVYKVPGAADVHSFSNGALGSYANAVGADIGQRALKNAKNKDGTPQMKGRQLTEAEAKDLQADVRNVVAGEVAEMKKLLEAHRSELTRTEITPPRRQAAPVSAPIFY